MECLLTAAIPTTLSSQKAKNDSQGSLVPTLSVRALCWVQPRSTVEFRGALATRELRIEFGAYSGKASSDI